MTESPRSHLYYYNARLIRVVDGDTIVVDVDLGFDSITTRRRLRLLDVDTPERGEEGYEKAKILTSKILSSASRIIVHTVSHDSFGRWLAQVWCDEMSLNKMLIDSGWTYG